MPGQVAPTLVVDDADLDVATRTLWGECRGEPEAGRIAVAWVIRTRAEWRPEQWWGGSVAAVCRKPKQFSCWNATDPNYQGCISIPEDDPEYQALREIARLVFEGWAENPAVIDGKPATHYRASDAQSDWSIGRYGVRIGRHDFFAVGPGG